MRNKRNVKKQERIFENLHSSRNIKSNKIPSIKVTDKHVHDCAALHKLIKNIVKSGNTAALGKLFTDGAYVGKNFFRYLSDN